MRKTDWKAMAMEVNCREMNFGNDTWRAFAVKGSMVVHTGKVTTE